MITVEQFIEELKTCDPKARVRLAGDEEGNSYADFLEIQFDNHGIYIHPDAASVAYWESMDDDETEISSA